MFIRIFSLLIIIIFCNSSFAASNCTEPSVPDCANNQETYKNKESYESCRTELESLSEKTKEYVGCLKNELQVIADGVQSKVDAISDKTNSIIEKFNCRANTKASC